MSDGVLRFAPARIPTCPCGEEIGYLRGVVAHWQLKEWGLDSTKPATFTATVQCSKCSRTQEVELALDS